MTKSINLSLTRRQILGAGAYATACMLSPPSFSLTAFAEQVEKLKKEGWTSHPVACTMCGAFCGLLALTKDGAELSEKTIRIFPNPGHPQQGYCGRAAAALWVWNHPLRLRKPLKRVGERGEGKFEEVSWDEALNSIAKSLKTVVEKYGEASVASTSHSFSGFSAWITMPLGSPNNIGHQSTCNAGGIGGRGWVFGKGFADAGKMEPDYANLRYLILIGRSMGSAMGALHTLNVARAKGAKVVAVDPRMPDIAYGDAKWLGIRPGTDVAFVYSLINELIENGLADFDFLRRHTNAAFLIKENGKPLMANEINSKQPKELYVVADSKGTLSFIGPKKNEKGAVVAFVEDLNFKPELAYQGTVATADGSKIPVRTAFNILREKASKYSPNKASEITGIPAETIRQLAQEFAKFKGVIDDGWYTSKNGTDVELYQLICIANAVNGNIDVPGGLIVTQGGGLKIPSVSAGKGPNGEKWDMAKEKRIDKILYPEANGTFQAALDAATTGKPYPIKAAFIVGSTMFHREANSDRLAKNLKNLDLLVVQDIFPHEIVDYADYVLPATYFLERKEMAGVKWARDGSIHLSDPQITPPKGCDARHDVWILLEILRRAYPERAKRVGYTECKTAQEFDKYFNAFIDKGFNKFLKAADEAKPGSADKIRKDIETQGWSTVRMKQYGVYPYKKPFDTPSGKVEVYGFKSFSKDGYDKVFAPLPEYVPSPAYTSPKPNSNEFVLVSGKNCVTSSGLNIFTQPTRFMGDRTLWMNPTDASRLGIRNGEIVEVEGIDTGYKAPVKVTVTKKVVPGAVFAYSFSGAVRTKNLVNNPDFQFVKEGINSHWYATGYAQPIIGNLANNSAVRINRLKG